MTDIGELFRDNVWAAVLVALGCFVVLLLCIMATVVIVYCCNKKINKRRRVAYSRLRQDTQLGSETGGNHYQQRNEEGLYEAMQRQRVEQEATRRETGLLNCQYYLRSNQKYVMESHLPDIGSRISKNWFMVRSVASNATSSPLLLTMLPIGQQCRLNLQSSDKHVIKKLFKAIEHPYVHKLIGVDYIPDKRIVVVLEPFCQRGSLKDLIYQTTPAQSWSIKYSVRRNGLRLNQIKTYGRQILEAVKYLHEIGFNPLGQIQSGNIFVEGSKCRVSGYDNSLLSYKPRIFRNIKQYQENLDSAMFGHLLFELASGRELSNTCPSEEDYRSVRLPQVIEVIRYIFQDASVGKLPSIDEIIDMPFFSGVRTSELEQFSSEGMLLDEDMTALIYKSRKGKSKGVPVSNKKKKTVVGSESSYTKSSSQPQRTKLEDDSSTATDRTALLSDIQKGTVLRHTETNDRSAPKI